MVVTASVDSTDAHGQTDWALGWFRSSEDLVECVKTILIDWWRYQQDTWGQPAWECVMTTGRISEMVALQWQEECWDE